MYDQWFGLVSWTADMKHPGPVDWPADRYPDPYNDRPADGSTARDNRWNRYLGDAASFNDAMRAYLKSTGGDEPTSYHAQAAGQLLLVQMAIEQANQGWGLEFEHLKELDGEIDDAVRFLGRLFSRMFGLTLGPLVRFLGHFLVSF